MNYRELISKASRYTPGHEVYDLAMNIIARHGIDSDEAIAGIFVLLFCWNKSFYGRKTFSEMGKHIEEFRRFIRREKELILKLRCLRLEEINFSEVIDGMTIGDAIYHLFDKLRSFLGLVGASKALHLLLPNLVVMWDNSIINRYGVPKSTRGFLEFQKRMKMELDEAINSYMAEHGVGREEAIRKILHERYGDTPRPLTKMLDEYNWVVTRRWRASDRSTLMGLRKEIDVLLTGGLDQNVYKNLLEAISEYEEGSYLASALIVSRAITYMIEKLGGKRKPVEEFVEELVKTGLIPKDRKDEQRELLIAIRMARNFLAHRVDVYAKPEDVLILLGGAVKLARIYLEWSRSRGNNRLRPWGLRGTLATERCQLGARRLLPFSSSINSGLP